MRTAFASTIALAIGVCSGPLAWGHGARPSVFDVVERDGAVVGMATTFGVIHDGGGGEGLTWACTAAVPATPTGYLFAGDDVIATTTDGLWISADSGCSYTSLATDIDDPVVTEVRRDGVAGTTWLVTASLDAPNSVYRSADDGRTWQRVGDALDDTALYGLAVADDRVVVTALNAEIGWSVLEWAEDGPTEVGPVPDGLLDIEVWLAGDAVWLADIRMLTSTLYAMGEDGAFVPWGDPVEGVITDVAEVDGEVFVATDTDAVYRAEPGALTRVDGASGACFVDDVADGSMRCGTTASGVAIWGGPVDGSEPRVAFDAITPAACVFEETHPCASVAEFATEFLGSEASSGGGATGCSATPRSMPAAGWPAVLCGALVAGRRTRRGRRPNKAESSIDV